MFCASVAVALLLGQTGSLKPYQLAPGFKVSLPGAPVPLNLGASPKGAEVHTWYVKVSQGAFIISVAKSSGPETSWPPKRVLANFVAGYLHSSRSEVVSRKEATLNGWPGAEIKAKSPAGITSHFRVFVANGTTYQVAAASAPGEKPLPSTLAVLNSIVLKPAGR